MCERDWQDDGDDDADIDADEDTQTDAVFDDGNGGSRLKSRSYE